LKTVFFRKMFSRAGPGFSMLERRLKIMLQALIFDLDGVVVDSHPAHKRAWSTFFASLGRKFSDAELEFVVEGNKREEILRHFLGELTPEQIREYGARKEALFRNFAGELKPIPGLEDFFADITAAGLPTALASSASRARVEYMVRQLGLAGNFHAIVTGDDVSRGKPDPALFQMAAAQLGIEPGEILVCEDAVNGVAAAKAAGMKCLAIAANGRAPMLAKAGADKIIQDFTVIRLEGLKSLFVE
jgi:beta-phosphoglucomutase